MAECIEREKAIELLSEPITMSMCLSMDECHHKIAQRRIDLYLIENIPASDVRPVVRGKWIYNHWCEFICSNCGAWSKSEPYRGRENFCPNCGADMREES